MKRHIHEIINTQEISFSITVELIFVLKASLMKVNSEAY